MSPEDLNRHNTSASYTNLPPVVFIIYPNTTSLPGSHALSVVTDISDFSWRFGGLESEGEEEEPLEFGHLLHFQQKRLIAHGREW